MKNIIFTIFSVFIVIFAFPQITLTDMDIVDVGDVILQSYDNNPSSSINLGSPGLNQNWDFSSLQTSYIDTLAFISPIGTPYECLYSNVNLCMENQGSISYFNKNNNGFYVHGTSDTIFNNPVLSLPLPLTYNLSTTDGPVTMIEQKVTGTLLSLAIPPSTVALLTSNMANRADTALIEITNSTEFLVDASGTLTIPIGAYEVLRLKIINNIVSVLNVYCIDTISGTGMWLNNIPFSSIPFLANYANNEKEIKYQWLTNDNSVEFLLAEIVVDSLDNILNGVSFQTINQISSNNHFPLEMLNIYPVPAENYINIESDINSILHIELLSVDGSLIQSNDFYNNMKLDISFVRSGVYVLKIFSEEYLTYKKIVIE